MKKYIREVLDELNRKGSRRGAPPQATTPATTPDDLNNQELSSDPAERVKQLDFQAQENEERESS